jgi:Tol biopolymer transport system component/DNA-binding winged helix-turn-helix (wHTH) protein
MMDTKPLIFQFDTIQVNPQTFKILKDGSAVSLEPKAFEVLVFLLHQHGRLVEKDELLEAIWKEAYVTPNALTRVIAQLRKTLGDDAKDARYIETVPTRGYRFIAEVKTLEGGNGKQGLRNGESWRDHETHEMNESDETPPLLPNPFRLFRFFRVFRDLSSFPRWRTISLVVLPALLVGLWLWQQRTVREKPGIARTIQITSSPLLDLYPTFSPDGQSLAYSALRNGSFEIVVKPLTPGSREVQVTADGANNVQPTWSPDGKQIAFHSRQRGGIWVLPALGGVAQQRVDFGADPAWSPDGKWIAFQSIAPVDIAQTAFAALPPSTLWLVPAEGGTATPLTRKQHPTGGHGAPAWSPDSQRVAFVSYSPGRSEIWTVTADGKEQQSLIGGAYNFYDPVFAPDGNYIFWTTGAGNFQLWRSRISLTTGQSLGEPEEIANTGAALARYLTIAPDGKRLAYSSLVMANNIGSVAVSPQTGAAVGEPILLTQDTNRRKTAPNFSPDGSTIVYSMWKAGAPGELWLMDADGSNARQLTTGLAGLPNWLPDGQRVCVVSKDGTDFRMWAIEVKTGKQTVLSNQIFPIALGKLSPDGTLFAFNSNTDGTYNISTLPLAGGAARQLTFDQEMMGFPCWSRDSQWLAFEVKRGEDTHIAVMPRDGGTPEQITSEPGQSWPGGWAMDHDRIAFAGQRNGIWNLYWVSRRTKEQTQLTNFTKPHSYVRYPVWSPRSDQIVYEYGETTGNVWLLELK